MLENATLKRSSITILNNMLLTRRYYVFILHLEHDIHKIQGTLNMFRPFS